MNRETAILLSDEVLDRLSAVSARTGRTAEWQMREAIEEHVGELEDVVLAEQALARRRRGGSHMYSLEEFSRDLGLDD